MLACQINLEKYIRLVTYHNTNDQLFVMKL